MLIEINLLKEKHGVLAYYERHGTVPQGAGVHKRRTFSILLLTILLGVLVGLNYGDRIFAPLSAPLARSLDYTLEMIPALIAKVKDIGGEEPEEALPPLVEEVEKGAGEMFEALGDIAEPEASKAPEEAPEKAPGDLFALIEQEKEGAPPSPAPQPEPQKAAPAPTPAPPPPAVEPAPAPAAPAPTPAPAPKPEPAAPPAPEKLAGTYINAGAYLLPDNAKKLAKAGKTKGFGVVTETIHRKLTNHFFELGVVKNRDDAERARKDIEKRGIDVEVLESSGGFVVRTAPTPLSFVAKRQAGILAKAGYHASQKQEKRQTPLTKILVGPLSEGKISGIASWLKKEGFQAEIIRP